MKTKPNNPDMEALRTIILEYLGSDVQGRRKEDDIVYARMIFFKIMKEHKYSLKIIGKFVNRTHAAVINGLTKFDQQCAAESQLDVDYTICRNKLYEFKGDTLKLSEAEMRKEMLSLNRRLEGMATENLRLKGRMVKNLRLTDIIAMIDERTPKGEEEFIGRKINAMFNGISWR